MGAKNPEKELMKNFGKFDTCVNLVDSALFSAKTKPKKLYELKAKLETLLYSFDEAYRVYKADGIAKEAETEEAFNASPTFSKKDSWFDRFIEKTESIEEKIDTLEELQVQDKAAPEAKPAEIAQENVNHIETEVKSEKGSLGQSLTGFVDEVNACDDIPLPTAEAMEKFSEKLKMRWSI